MSKFKDTTKGGYKILWREEIKEGERKGCSFGQVSTGSRSHTAVWNEDGVALDSADFDLVPAEPEIVRTLYMNVYPENVGGYSSSLTYLSREYGTTYRLGAIRLDYYDDGTFTVNKEEV